VKITFEGAFVEILEQMRGLLAVADRAVRQAPKTDEIKNVAVAPVQGPGPEAIVPEAIVPVDKPVDKPVDPRIAKMRAARIAKAAERAAAAKAEEEEERPDPLAEPVDPAEAVRIRQKTIEDLQTAYADGHQKEVFELLSRFGNGAKSFRELPPEAFLPISKAIANGALT
jgi:outer membrane biosynthesis protein TonB